MLLLSGSPAAPPRIQAHPLQPRRMQDYSVCQAWCATKLSNPAEVDIVCPNPQCSACEVCKGATSTEQLADEQPMTPLATPTAPMPLTTPTAPMLANTYGTDEGLANFKDVTESMLPEAWQGWGHSGKPHKHQGTPAFVDWVGDGKMSYIYHNHYESEPMTGAALSCNLRCYPRGRDSQLVASRLSPAAQTGTSACRATNWAGRASSR